MMSLRRSRRPFLPAFLVLYSKVPRSQLHTAFMAELLGLRLLLAAALLLCVCASMLGRRWLLFDLVFIAAGFFVPVCYYAFTLLYCNVLVTVVAAAVDEVVTAATTTPSLHCHIVSYEEKARERKREREKGVVSPPLGRVSISDSSLPLLPTVACFSITIIFRRFTPSASSMT